MNLENIENKNYFSNTIINVTEKYNKNNILLNNNNIINYIKNLIYNINNSNIIDIGKNWENIQITEISDIFDNISKKIYNLIYVINLPQNEISLQENLNKIMTE